LWVLRSNIPIEVVRGDAARCGKALLIAVAVWGAWLLGLSAPFDAVLYDAYQHALSSSTDLSAEVLLVQLDREEEQADGATLVDLARRLRRLGATSVGFTHAPSDEELYRQAAEELENVVVGRQLVLDRRDASGRSLEALPPGVEPGRHFGVVTVGPSTRGILREQRAWVEIDGVRHVALEVLLSPGVARAEDSDEFYLIRFRGGAGSLPIVNASTVLAEGMVPEIVAGRAVLIGPMIDRNSRIIETPSTIGAERMSQLELHGHALNTLLNDRRTARLGGGALLSLVVAIAFCSWLIFQWVDVRFATWITASACLFYLVLTWLLLDWANVWTPVADVLVVQCGTFVYGLKSRASVATEAMARLTLSSAAALKDRDSQGSFHESSQHWALIVNMVNQTLDLNRVIFMEAVPGRRTLREIISLNCSVSDISEKRRDYDRAPFLTALEARAPMQVEQFLKKSFQDEEQYLVPLVFNEEVLGFWAFGVDPERAAAIPSFQSLLGEYGQLVSELLYQRKQVQSRELTNARLDRSMRVGRVERLYRELGGTVKVLGTRLAQTEALLSGFNTATVVYDLFGRVITVNKSMVDLLARENLDCQRMTALDLVSSVSEYDLSRSRRILRHVIIEQQTMTLPVTLAGHGKRRFLLHLKPLSSRDVDATVADTVAIGAKCVLCELVDTTPFVGLFEMKEKLTQRLGLQLRNDLASIELSSSILGSEGLTDSQRENISQIIHDKVAKMMDVLVECHQYLTLEGSVSHVERFPVDSVEYFEGAVDDLRSVMAHRGIEIEVERPNVMSYVLASSESIRTVFSTILRVILSDALDNSSLIVQVIEDADMVTYQFRNTGFGIPNDRFQEYIFGDKTLATEELKTLREAIRWTSAWGGVLEAESQVGRGIEITLRLVKFM